MAEKLEVGDYDIRGADLRQLYAGFCRRTLSDSAIWSLSLAQSVIDESLPNHMGYKAWITYVADVDCYNADIAGWAIGLGAAMADTRPLLRKRRKVLVPSYKPEWGRAASRDGVQMALCGIKSAPPLAHRAEEFGINREPFQRVRDLVAGVLVLQMGQFEDALGWAVRLQRRG